MEQTIYSTFIMECLQENELSNSSFDKVYQQFKLWFLNTNNYDRCPDRVIVKEELIKLLGPLTNKKWLYMRIKSRDELTY